MRCALLILGLASLALVACGDASPSSGSARTANPKLAGGVDDGLPAEGEHAVDPGNSNAKTPPAPPAAPGQSAGELAVTLEPAGGSPTGAPTGPIVYSGKLTL